MHLCRRCVYSMFITFNSLSNIYLHLWTWSSLIKSPQSGVTVFSPFLLPLMSKPFELNLRYLAQIIYGSGEMYWMTYPWPWPKVTAVASISKNLLVCVIKWELLIRSLPKVAAVLLYSWLLPDYILEKFCCKLLFWQIFFQISDVFFQGQTLFWPFLRNGWSDWCETKRKCICWILGTICDLDLWTHLWPWPWIFQGQIWK